MKNVFLLISLFLMLFACSKTTQEDLCEGVICKNGGTCINGDCSCPPGYTGTDCGQEKVPVKMRVTNITLNTFPHTDQNGAGWDVFDGPDVYIQIKKGSTLIYKSGFIEDLATSYTYNANAEFSDPQATYTIEVYDYDDGLTADDYMGGINFTPYQSGFNFPDLYNIQCGNCVVSFTFTGVIYTH
mgnify:FL=1